MKKITTLFTVLFVAVGMMAQTSQNYWKDITTASAISANDVKSYLPMSSARTLSLDADGIQKYLLAAPQEFTDAAENKPLVVGIPSPEGEMHAFGIYEISIMEPGLAAAFPEIKTYSGKSLHDPSSFIRITTGSLGFHATVFTGGKTDIIEPVSVGQTGVYACYHLDDADGHGPIACGNHDIEEQIDEVFGQMNEDKEVFFTNKSLSVPVNLRTYRLALATTVEFSNQNGGNENSVLNAVTNIMNQVNFIFEHENSIRFILLANTTETFFFGAANSDPYTNGDAGAMIVQNPPQLNNAYGLDGYDIGHVFGKALGGGVVGLATLSSVCGDEKGRGVSNTLGPDFFITVAHEMGHQFSATHTFNLCDGDNETPSTGYEPGGGSTIMAYAGACTTNTVQQESDAYFHISALEKILAFSTNTTPVGGGGCANVISTPNNTPEASIPMAGGFVIPVRTPFELTGEATDPDGDELNYCWEQYDLGPASPLGMPSSNGTPPLFRSYLPKDNPHRVFPKIETIIGNTIDIREVLPTTTRALTFRMTARDNNNEAGGYDFAQITFTSNVNAGPFRVTAPNDGTESWEVGEYVEVTWDVANTNGPQVNAQSVDIYLSTDGGFTYPVVLLENTKNDGSAFVVVPDEVTSSARVKVKGRGNIFFDISNANFDILPATAPDFTVSSYSPEDGQVCVPATFDVTLETAAILGFTEMISFSVNGLPAGATTSFTNNPVMPGGSTVLTIDFANVTEDGIFDVAVVAEATGVDAETRIVQLNVVNSDFSAMTLSSPGGSAISVLPTFNWSALANASTYDIQIATDPDFTNIIDSATGLTAATYQSAVTLEENAVYYWRVLASNECGAGSFGEIKAFKTISQACVTYASTGTVAIPSGSGFAESIINVPVGGQISDVNIKNVSGIYDAFVNLTFDLISPTNTTVSVMTQRPCNSGLPFVVGFDDESPLAQSTMPCPPASGTSYKSAQPLSGFVGEDAAGNWKFKTNVVGNFAGGGNLTSWQLEICGSAQPNDPQLENNNPICVRPGENAILSVGDLSVTDPDNAPNELTFTIVKNAVNGFLSKSGAQLAVGDKFTMQNIIAFSVDYTNTNTGATTDEFTFFVEDVTGGFNGLFTATFEINNDCTVGTREILLDGDQLSVYPNPATDLLNIESLDQAVQMEQISIFNSQGQLVLGHQVQHLVGKAQINVGHLPTGIYLVQVRTAKGVMAKKVLID